MASAEDPSISCSQEEEADSTEQLSHSETNQTSSGPPNTTDESNGTVSISLGLFITSFYFVVFDVVMEF